MPGQDPERGGCLTDCSAGHPEQRGPMVFRLLAQLSTAYGGSATPKDCPVEAFKAQSLSRAPCVLVMGRREGSLEHQSFDTYLDSHPNLDL